MRKFYCTKCKKYKEFKKPKISYICDKTLPFLVFITIVEVKMKKIFKEEESIEIAKILGLIINI